ncbi:glycosyltransferase [Egicoccus halophilus]|uniref:Glycosyl transferase family 1 n=1 Tax=Egicoccus halophilus TaxID=1670830 RepID=A0A8J3AE84_9ACTN|nr:glycosyltransferase [Egicoccus halophilus]GGI05991.1 glycosyl transferase family 1 [Egicoccus halophilus]
MHVLVVTTVHTPLDARVHHRQIRSLVAAGVEVTYAAPFRATGTDPGQVLAGVRTIDLPHAVGRRRLGALLAARRLLASVARSGGVDLVLLHDPELAAAVVGRLGGLPPVVLDVHEDLVGSLPDRPWVPAALRPPATVLARALERWAEGALHLLLAEDAYQRRFLRPHPVVPNLPWAPSGALPAAGSAERVVYVGRVSRFRGAFELVGLGERLHAADGPHLEVVGPADAEVRPVLVEAEARGVLTWRGYLPNDRALARVHGAVAGLSLLHDVPNYRVSMPTKVVEYLSLGVPVVTTPLPAATALVEAAGGGVVVPFADADAAADAVLALAADRERCASLGAAGRAFVVAHHSWDAAAPRFVAQLTDWARDGAAA